MSSNKNYLPIFALVLSLMPFLVFLPPMFDIHIDSTLQAIWAAANLTCITAAFLLCLVNMARSTKTSWVTVSALVISASLLLLASGITGLALLLNFQ